MYKFADVIREESVLRGHQVYIKEDPQEGPFVRVVDPITRKQIAIACLELSPVKVLTKRVEAQHTMNCLLMQELDYSQPWCSLNLCHPDEKRSDVVALEDSVQAVFNLHTKLSQNGFRLWESNSIQQQNSLKIRNIYVRQDTVNNLIDAGDWEGEVTGVVLEAHLTTTDFSKVLDTDKIPGVFWAITLDHEQGRIGHAERIDPVNKFKADVKLSTGVSSVSDLPPVEVKLNYTLADAFNVRHTTGMQITSQPGRVNTVKVYRCVDSNRRAFQLLLKYNL